MSSNVESCNIEKTNKLMIFLLSSGKLRFEKAPKNVKHTRQMQNKNYSFRFVFYGNIFLARKAPSEAFRKTLR